MPSIGARGPSREGYLKMRGPNLRLENTSLHREDFVRVDKFHATSAEHDSDRAIFLRREVDRPLDRRVRDSLSADPVVKSDLREDLRILLRSFRIGLDFERREGDALLPKDQDDVGGRAGHRREEGSLYRARTLTSLQIACIEQDLGGLLGLRSESQRVDVDQMGLHRCHRSSQVGALDELRSEPAKLLFGRPIGWAVRPRVIINAAMSVDGNIALPDGPGVRLS